jgi:hypothetical protein
VGSGGGACLGEGDVAAIREGSDDEAAWWRVWGSGIGG